MFLVRPASAVAVQEKFRNALPHFAGQRHLRIRVVNDESERLHFAIFLVLTEEQRRADTGILPVLGKAENSNVPATSW
jgi:hypothetical protein